MKTTGSQIRRVAGILSLTFAFSLGATAQDQELSHARIVRLSFAEGNVTVHRPDVAEWSAAPVNTPIQEGFKVATGLSGFAEIEFENASTARIGQRTLLEFTQLALLPSGGKVNRMHLAEGYGTFNLLPESDDIYEVTVGTATLTPQGKCRFRVDWEEGVLQVKVFKGSVEIMSPEGTGTLGKNTVLEIRPSGDQPFEISQGITRDDWDKWVEEREERSELVRQMGPGRVLSGFTNNASGIIWGAMDLMYYGSWFHDPLYGYGWVPTVGPGWSPFSYGRWTWLPGWGYTWIGYEPWGWLPYHYGSWTYNQGIGWCWFPSATFGTWSPAAVQWYRGNGAVGWSPRWRDSGGACTAPNGCVATVPETTLSEGRPVRPGDIRWGRSFDNGRPVERVDITPGRSALLPGSTVDFSRGFARGAGDAGSTREGGISVVGGTTAPARSSGVAFDPDTRTYVNRPEARADTGSAGVAGRSGRDAASGIARPGPVNNYPVQPGSWGRQTGSAPRGESARGASGADDNGWIRSNAVGWGNNAGSRTDSGGSRSSSSAASSTSSGGRSASGSSGGWGGDSSAGSRSAGGSGGSSSGGSSGGWGGGGRPSGSSSGGWGGGGHSSGGGGWGGGGRSSGGGSSGGGSSGAGSTRR
jgi:hypothetical protein